METGNNLQMIHEQEGENFAQNIDVSADAPDTQVHQIENDINLIQQQKDESGRGAQVEYENDEDELICGRFPHLDVCACEISCQVALKEINLF